MRRLVTVDPITGGSISLTEGDLTINADGSFTFTPAANFNGPGPAGDVYDLGWIVDRYGDTLDITIGATPDAVDDIVSINEDGGAVLLDPLNNDDLGAGSDGVDDVTIPNGASSISGRPDLYSGWHRSIDGRRRWGFNVGD